MSYLISKECTRTPPQESRRFWAFRVPLLFSVWELALSFMHVCVCLLHVVCVYVHAVVCVVYVCMWCGVLCVCDIYMNVVVSV